MKIKSIAKMPRLKTIPSLEIQAYRDLQAGQAVEVPDEAGHYLVQNGFAEETEVN